jgi:hypothetical protein
MIASRLFVKPESSESYGLTQTAAGGGLATRLPVACNETFSHFHAMLESGPMPGYTLSAWFDSQVTHYDSIPVWFRTIQITPSVYSPERLVSCEKAYTEDKVESKVCKSYFIFMKN